MQYLQKEEQACGSRYPFPSPTPGNYRGKSSTVCFHRSHPLDTRGQAPLSIRVRENQTTSSPQHHRQLLIVGSTFLQNQRIIRSKLVAHTFCYRGDVLNDK